mmetsp:Transcript_120589/g.240122  ORF Transcript_120589/g.240122 Transcript_120589/m.240122 type:complete len:329 (-) Transcript_120589:60-1046(-)
MMAYGGGSPMGSQLSDGPLPRPPEGWDATASTTGGQACGTESGCGTGVCPSDGRAAHNGEWVAHPDGQSASMAQNGCWSESTENLVRYQYAGQGRGSYEKVPTYTYVGEGRGSFDKEAIGSDSRGCGQCTCLVCVVVGALALLAGLVALQAKDLGPAIAGVVRPSSKEEDGARTGSVDCEALVRNLEQGVDASQAEQVDWCCANEQKGCSHLRSTTTERFDCEADYSSWHSTWPAPKRAYCCHMYARGCQADDHTRIDCQAGFDNWRAGWSDIKKKYCCRTAQRGCGGTTTTEPYDCASGFDFWESAWSDSKADWCCHTYRRGCKKNS